MKKTRVTSRDVAQAAGVSYNTVSLVMHNSPLVAPTTKAHVQEVIAQLGYQPHAAAAALRSSRSQTIGYFVQKELKAFNAEIDVFYNQLLRAITSCTEDAGYHVLLTSSSSEQQVASLLNSGRIDGALINWRRGDTILKQLVEKAIPTVLVGRDSGLLPISWVKADEEGGAYQATRHLVERGHRRFGLVTAGEDNDAIVSERVHGFERALAEVGILIEPTFIVHGDWTHRSGYELALYLLTLQPRPTAMFVLSELMAAGVLQAAQSLGLHIPGDLALITTEDSPWVEYVRPQLSAVHVPMYEVGTLSAEMLLALLDGTTDAPQQVTLPTKFVVRESSVML